MSDVKRQHPGEGESPRPDSGSQDTNSPDTSSPDTSSPDTSSLDISIVIPCFNGNATLGLQLEALVRQVDPPAYEVLVVDNRSSEPPDVIVQEWHERYDAAGVALRLVRAVEGQGISVARNVGVREAGAERMALCDADDVAGPTFVRAAYEGLDRADLVTGTVTRFEGIEFEGAKAAAVIDRLRDAMDTGADPRGALDFEHSDVDPIYPIIMGGACSFHRSVVLALDGWDQAFFPGVEDNDFALRAVRAGYTFGKSDAMTLAERGRRSNAQAFRRAFDGGRMHMKLCAAHDLWSTSPHLHRPVWWKDLAKLPVATAQMALSRSDRDVLGLAGRWGLRTGQAGGFVRYRLFHRPITRQPGVGLTSAENGRAS